MEVKFSPPDISELEIREVTDVLRSGWITTGPKTKELERKIAAFCGVDYAVCLNSQTACAEMALRVLGVGEGDEVIVPAYTYTATAAVVNHVGAKIVLVDSQKDSVEMDYDKVESAITERTKVIIPVDLGGIPCDYDRLFRIVAEKKHLFHGKTPIQKAFGRVIILADTAHALGGKWHDRPIGSVADFSAFSFHAVKNFTTSEGGALTWKSVPGVDSEEIYRQLQLLSLHGQSKDALAKSGLGTWEYDIVGLWYKCNMTDVSAAMGLAQMQRYPEMLERRKEIIRRYDGALRPLGVESLHHDTREHMSSGHLYMTRVPGISSSQRNEIIGKMAEKGVACNVHYKPLPMHTAYRKLGFNIAEYENAYAMFANEITLPLYTALTDEQVDYVIDCYGGIVKAYVQ